MCIRNNQHCSMQRYAISMSQILHMQMQFIIMKSQSSSFRGFVERPRPFGKWIWDSRRP